MEQAKGVTPKSNPFMIQVPTKKSREYHKGKIIKIDGIEHAINSISRVEIGGDLVKIIGKSKPTGRGLGHV